MNVDVVNEYLTSPHKAVKLLWWTAGQNWGFKQDLRFFFFEEDIDE